MSSVKGFPIRNQPVFDHLSKTVSDMYLPLSGEILELNPVIETNPETINKDPYGEGWIASIKLSDSNELDSLLAPADYEKLIS